MCLFLNHLKVVLLITSILFGNIELLENLALGKQAYQTDTAFSGTPNKAVDGDLSQYYSDGSCTHTATLANAYWEVDLGKSSAIDHVRIYNRQNSAHRLRDVELYIGTDKNSYILMGFKQGQVGSNYTFQLEDNVQGRWVRITRLSSVNEYFTLCEVQVYGYRTAYFRKYQTLVGIGDIIKMLVTKSPIQCGYLCLKDQDCRAVNYQANGSHCVLLSSITNQTSTDNGIVFMK